MAKHALLYNKIVKQIVNTSSEKFDVTPGLVWHELTQADLDNGVVYGSIKQADDSFVNPTSEGLTEEGVCVQVKYLLTNSDWTQLTDSGLSAQEKTDYDTYRADLITIATAPIEDPDNITWPTKPVTTNIRE